MKTLNVADMKCPNCVKKIDEALTKADLKHEINLDSKTVSIDGCDNCLALRRRKMRNRQTAENEKAGRVFPGSLPFYMYWRMQKRR